MRKLFLFLLSFVFALLQSAAQTPGAEPTAMESNGKIYVVLVVCLTILMGLILYIIRVDRKLTRLEKKND